MSRIGAIAALLALASCVAARGGEDSRQKGARVAAVVELRDTTRLVGGIPAGSFRVRGSYGTITVPFHQARTIEVGRQQERVSCVLCNGDRLIGSLDLETLSLHTSFGEVVLEMPMIERITMTQCGKTSLPPDLAVHLVLYLPLDEAGAQVLDASARENHGKVHGATQQPDGKVGGCYRVRVPDQYIEVPEPAGIPGGNDDRTIALWFRTRSTRLPILLHGGDKRFGIGVARNGQIFSTQFRAGAPVTDRKWHQFVVVHSSGGWGAHYLDGQALSDPVGYMKRKLTTGTGGSIYIGKNFATDPLHGAEGEIDEVMIFDRALSAEEVRLLYDLQN